MQSSLLNPGIYGLVQATVGVGTLLIWDFCVAYTVGEGGGYFLLGHHGLQAGLYHLLWHLTWERIILEKIVFSPPVDHGDPFWYPPVEV